MTSPTDRTRPSPLDVARSKRLPAIPPSAGAGNEVLFVYVDNSNVWIEGQRISAVKKGLAKSTHDAMERKVLAHWSYDFGRLYELACPSGMKIGRSILFGSRPPVNDSLWQRAEAGGFQVTALDRNAANKEKKVDTSLTQMINDDYIDHMKPERGDMLVLVAGDGDFVPTINSLKRRGIRVRVVFWRHATSRELREAADEFVELDPHFDWLSLHQSRS